jgi:DNA-binding transcriptional LysR family regulator
MAELSVDDLSVFVRVVERGSFASAARELGVPTSTVSRAVARLEGTASVRLLQRTTRSVRTTSEGQALYASIAPAVSTLRSAARALEPATSKPKGRLRITAPSDLCATFLADVIVAFGREQPLVQLDFTLTNQHTNLVESGFDVALRATGKLASSSLVARKLGEMQHGLYAAPAYLQAFGIPAAPDDLPRHQCIVFRGEELRRSWLLSRGTQQIRVEVQGRMGGDDFAFVRAMIVGGAGIGLLPRLNCSADEASGRLVRVLPEFHARGASLYILYPSARNVPARVKAFRDFMIDAFAKI